MELERRSKVTLNEARLLLGARMPFGSRFEEAFQDELKRHLGSALMIVGALPLALGSAAGIAGVFYKINLNSGTGLAALGPLVCAGLLYPVRRRWNRGAGIAATHERSTG